ncbi:MAG: hypothetical protein ABI573_00490 [Chloroflexota bacterium]
MKHLFSALAVGMTMLVLPATVAAHQLSKLFESRLPLAVYLVGAASAVGLSFAFVLAREVPSAAPDESGAGRPVPAAIRMALRLVGLVGWIWIMVQGVLGGESDAEVTRLFTWVYGWVGVALISAFAFPIWTWLNPFSTLHDLGASVLRRLGVAPVPSASYPGALGRWPAVIGFGAIVWLELVAFGAGSRTLALVVGGYTVYTLAMMAQYGRRTWTEHGEVFSVWFALLGRLALTTHVSGEDDVAIRRRSFGSGLMAGGWTRADVVMIGLGTGSILFDGLSQTQIWVTTFGLPAALPQTLIIAAFMTMIIGAALIVSRLVGVAATGAGLLPIAIGYLVAHYFTYLMIDGQRIVVALSDPLQRGADYFGTSSFEPTGAWLPPALVWGLQVVAVVGGHMVGAWAGHVVASREAGRHGQSTARQIRTRQIPLAIVMVALTTLTLWSLGQALFIAGS